MNTLIGTADALLPTLDDQRLSLPATKTGELQRAALRVLLEHHKTGMLPTSIRFVFYELEQQGAISKVTGKPIVSKVATGARRADQDLTDAIMDLRERKIIPFHWIEDETRSVTTYYASVSVKTYLIEATSRARINPWSDEPAPLILTESRSLAGILDSLLAKYVVPSSSNNGQSGGHLRNEVLPVYRDQCNRRVLYLGDMDRSGGHIEQNIRAVLEREGGSATFWERIAITQEQIVRYQLTPILKNDKRYKNGGGEHEAWETEALSQAIIVSLVRDRLDALLPESLASVQERERGERDRARRRIARWRGK